MQFQKSNIVKPLKFIFLSQQSNGRFLIQNIVNFVKNIILILKLKDTDTSAHLNFQT